MMKMISKEEAMSCIHNYGIAVHSGNIYSGWSYSGAESEYSFYSFNGCVITKYTNGNTRMSFYIYQTSGDADVCGVWKYVFENERIENIKTTIMIYACDPIPDEISIFLGFRVFTRMGSVYEDSDIRKMTEDDSEIIKELCEDSCNNDTHFGKCEAQEFYSFFENKSLRDRELLGVFDNGKLAGLVSVNINKKTGLAHVCDLFVHKNYRRCGIGRRLVKGAISLYPEAEYIYQAAKQNTASVELAKSIGFELSGAELWVFDEE